MLRTEFVLSLISDEQFLNVIGRLVVMNADPGTNVGLIPRAERKSSHDNCFGQSFWWVGLGASRLGLRDGGESTARSDRISQWEESEIE